MKTISSIILAVLISNCAFSQDHTDDLQRVLDRIDQIKSASYNVKNVSSAPWDTIPLNTFNSLESILIDPNDTIVGAKFTNRSIENINVLNSGYDGQYQIRLDWKSRNAKIDTMRLEKNNYPVSPCFIRVQSLINYSFSNPSNLIIKKYEYSDSIRFTFTFNDKLIEFQNLKPIVYNFKGKVSKYELITNPDYLPYKLVRKMEHQWSWVTLSKVDNSFIFDTDFSTIQQIPADFTINNNQNSRLDTKTLIGKKIRNLEFTTTSGNTLNLKDINEEAMLIQLTGIGCGHCHASIPFLNTLKEKYKNQSFEIIGVEQWNKDLKRIQRYVDKNGINYNYVIPTQETLEFFNSPSVPIFILVNKNREITDAFIGYDQGNSEEPIISAIEKLL